MKKSNYRKQKTHCCLTCKYFYDEPYRDLCNFCCMKLHRHIDVLAICDYYEEDKDE